MGSVGQRQHPARQGATLASTAPNLAARYTIPAASTLDYQVTITAYNQNSHWGYYGLGGWYGLGSWYGMGGWYGGLGGYYGMGSYYGMSRWYGGLGSYYGMGGYYGGMGSYYGGLGGYGWYGGGMAGWWNPWWYGAYGWLADPDEPALDPGFWNLRGTVDRVLHPTVLGETGPNDLAAAPQLVPLTVLWRGALRCASGVACPYASGRRISGSS